MPIIQLSNKLASPTVKRCDFWIGIEHIDACIFGPIASKFWIRFKSFFIVSIILWPLKFIGQRTGRASLPVYSTYKWTKYLVLCIEFVHKSSRNAIFALNEICLKSIIHVDWNKVPKTSPEHSPKWKYDLSIITQCLFGYSIVREQYLDEYHDKCLAFVHVYKWCACTRPTVDYYCSETSTAIFFRNVNFSPFERIFPHILLQWKILYKFIFRMATWYEYTISFVCF